MALYHVTIRNVADLSITFPLTAANPSALGGIVAASVLQNYGPGCTLRGVCGEGSLPDEQNAAWECSEKVPMHPGKAKPVKPTGQSGSEISAKAKA